MSKKLSVAFLWHMHQPLYKDLLTGKYYLPWVRLHATFSYLDMVSILADFPKVKCTFNLTPSLIYQLLDISADNDKDDIYLQLSQKDATCLTNEDKYFILKNFFSCDPATAILPVKRYRELFSRRGSKLRGKSIKRSKEVLSEVPKGYGSEGRKAKDFSVSDFRDLQVLFNLAWCGFTLRKKDPFIKELLKKGSGYTEEEKKKLLERQKKAATSVLPAYKRLQDEGRIEVSTSPFYHPILPLLCRGRSVEGFDFKKDAVWHVRRAVSFYKKVFGRKPLGMWPAEGGVSRESVPVFAAEGIKWIAADETILFKSFKGTRLERDELISSPFTASAGSRKVAMVFRNKALSDAISFAYRDMPPERSSRDFFDSIMRIKDTVRRRKKDYMVSVILDGENPWPHYPDGGRRFLSRIYGLLSANKDVRLVTISEYLQTHKKRKAIRKLAAGSWINADFSKWTGSPQKDKAWEYLRKTREAMFVSGEPDRKALEELYIAEGSDWFWWYDEFGTELNFVFDDLFRMHLANIYRIMDKDIPGYLKTPIYGN